jgi:hypothetical protein
MAIEHEPTVHAREEMIQYRNASGTDILSKPMALNG